MDGLAWLGLAPDAPAVFQSTREARHAEVARELLARGQAYRCFCTADELVAMREDARGKGLPPRYDGRWRDRDPAQAPDGVPYTIRLRAPAQGETVVEDLVQGTVRVGNAELDDMVLLRSDGRTPTYLHAVVVDDFDMGITHVIRGDDHLTNTFRQVQIYQAMGWTPPRFAHIPLIHGPDGGKLSKRHGASSVLDFQRQGYLPEALSNYLLRLGWGHGDAEILDRQDAIRLFDLDGVGRAAGRMDYAKLSHLNGVYLRAAEDGRLIELVWPHLTAIPDLRLDETLRTRLGQLMPALKERARTLVDLAQSAAFLARIRPLELDAKALALLDDDARRMLQDVSQTLAETDFTATALHAAMMRHAERTGRKLGQVAQPIRAALTGSTISPPVDQTLAVLGRDESIARLHDAISVK